VFTGATWGLLAAAGGRATAVNFGSPGLIRWRSGETTVKVGPWPVGSVEIFGRLADEPATDPRDWRNLSVARRLAVCIVPWLLVFAIAVACLGPGRAGTSFVHGVYQLLFVLDLTPPVRRLFALMTSAPIHVGLGLVLAKSTALNALPFPGLAGGGVIMELVGKPRLPWMLFGTLVMLFVTVRVVYALVHVLIGSA
jgi:membrane-associated protease RseP (regulator of RpoE activity)